MATNILLLSAHPDITNSKANAALLAAVSDLENVKIVDIYKAPFTAENYSADLASADVVVFQFPFWWGGPPAKMKEWLDTFMMGFQESPGVSGKKVLLATTVGSPESAYRAGGYDHFTIDEYLRPYEGAFAYAQMEYLTPFAVYGVSLPDGEVAIAAGAKAYRALLQSL